MLTFTAAAAMSGGQLRAELAAAGRPVDTRDMYVSGSQLHFPTLTEADRAVVEPVITAHVPDATWTATPQEANARTLRERSTAALTVNRDYLARKSPTAAQNTAQIQALTAQTSALIRLSLQAFDSVD